MKYIYELICSFIKKSQKNFKKLYLNYFLRNQINFDLQEIITDLANTCWNKCLFLNI